MKKIFALLLTLFLATACSEDQLENSEKWDLEEVKQEAEVEVQPELGRNLSFPYRDGGNDIGAFEISSSKAIEILSVTMRIEKSENVSVGGVTINTSESLGIVQIQSNQVGEFEIFLDEPFPIYDDEVFEIRTVLEVLSSVPLGFDGTALDLYFVEMSYTYPDEDNVYTFKKDLLISSYLEN